MDKTILLGMCDPKSEDPREALSARPGSAGERLWVMLNSAYGVSREEYESAFERRNVLTGKVWDRTLASRAKGPVLEAMANRRTVVLGVSTCQVLGLSSEPMFKWRRAQWIEGRKIQRKWHTDSAATKTKPLEFCVIPHPSGRCRLYNNQETKLQAAEILWKEMEQWRAAA